MTSSAALSGSENRAVPGPSSLGTLEPSSLARREAIDVSVLIVTWNSERWIRRCLAALPAAFASDPEVQGDEPTIPLSYEVIIHDNASGDETLRMLDADVDESLTVIDSAMNRGFAAGINSAARKASGRYLFCLNPDCEPAPGSIVALVEHLNANPCVGAAVPLLIGEDGHPQRDFQLRRFPTMASLAADVLLYEELAPDNSVSARYHCRDLKIDHPQDIEQPAGAALLLRRTLFDSVGELDEGFAPAWFEDVDYCRRVRDAGSTIQLVPRARVTHRGGASLDHVTFADFQAIWYRNLFRYATKWFRASEVEVLRWMIISGMFLRSAAVLVGISGPAGGGRLVAVRGYLRIAREAFKRWDRQSRSS